MSPPDVDGWCRSITEAFFEGGDRAALEELEMASLDVAPFVLNDELEPASAWDPLQEVAQNLGLVATFGQDCIQEVLASGPRICAAARRHALASGWIAV